jgi:hypothetical protein
MGNVWIREPTMSSGPPNPPQPANDAQVEAAVREVLTPLNRALSRLDSGMGLGLLVAGIATWKVFRRALDFAWWSSALLVVLAVVVAGVLWYCLEQWRVRRAVAEFDRRFPPGSAGRELALQVLSEMESPSKAERKLQEALGVTPPPELGPEPEEEPDDQIVRHRRAQPAGPPAAPPPEPPGPAPHKGYYDYIPLELPAQEEPKEGPAPAPPPASGPGTGAGGER